MSAAEIIVEIVQVGGEIWAEDGRLKFRGVPARLVPAIREHKAALLALLPEQTGQRSTPPVSVDPEPAMGPYGAGVATEHPDGSMTSKEQGKNRPPAPAAVTCGSCAEFTPDAINPAQGVGRCSLTANGLPPIASRGYGCCFPMAPRTCSDYKE